MRKAKAPKILTDSLAWIHSAIMEFGISGLQVRELIEFLKFALGNNNATVRTNSVTVLGALRVFVGPGNIFHSNNINNLLYFDLILNN